MGRKPISRWHSQHWKCASRIRVATCKLKINYFYTKGVSNGGHIMRRRISESEVIKIFFQMHIFDEFDDNWSLSASQSLNKRDLTKKAHASKLCTLSKQCFLRKKKSDVRSLDVLIFATMCQNTHFFGNYVKFHEKPARKVVKKSSLKENFVIQDLDDVSKNGKNDFLDRYTNRYGHQKNFYDIFWKSPFACKLFRNNDSSKNVLTKYLQW